MNIDMSFHELCFKLRQPTSLTSKLSLQLFIFCQVKLPQSPRMPTSLNHFYWKTCQFFLSDEVKCATSTLHVQVMYMHKRSVHRPGHTRFHIKTCYSATMTLIVRRSWFVDCTARVASCLADCRNPCRVF